MYRRVEPVLRMTSNEACVRYPDEFVLMRMDSMNPSDDMGTVLYVGDDFEELSYFVMTLDDPTNCGVTEGLNHRRSLGGVVVGA